MLHNFLFVAARHITRFLSALVIDGSEDGATVEPEGNSAIDPVYDAMSTFGPPLIGLLAAVMALYGAIMGFSYAKAEDSGERDKAKKKLVYGLIGFGVVLALIVILYALRGPITGVVNNETANLD